MSARYRYPFAPLEAVVLGPRRPHGNDCPCLLGGTVGRGIGICFTVAEIAEALGVSERQVHRFRLNGLDSIQADHLAIHIERHPAELWPEFTRIPRRAA